jgi:hypothetical protein
VLRTINFMSWAAKCGYRIDRIGDSALLTLTECPPQEARVRSGKGEFACRPTFEFGFQNVADVIDSRVKVSCSTALPVRIPQIAGASGNSGWKDERLG